MAQSEEDYARLSVDLEAMTAAGIPFDGDCISQGLMSSAFQTQKGGNFELYYQELRRAGKNFFLAQPPHVDVNLRDHQDGSFLRESTVNNFTFFLDLRKETDFGL